ncbi:lipase [Frankia canadensis]|nr:lipase [Frankia canadensis]
MPRHRWFGLTTALLLAAALAACSAGGGSASADAEAGALGRELAAPVAPPDTSRTPIVFLHGNLGSGEQFESQAQRFASNGYPADRITALDHDASSSTVTEGPVFARLDGEIQRLLTLAGTKQVDLVAHAEGADLGQRYLASSPARAARVAHLISVDGPQTLRTPKGVHTLVVWGAGDPTRRVAGADNVRFLEADRGQLLGAAATFRQMYRFLTGTDPFTDDVTPQRGPIDISGRALLYPANAGLGGARLEVYRLDPKTGRRLPNGLAGLFTLPADGSWGPLRADGTAYYEFAIVRAGEPVHHFYFEPFRRGDRLVRLLTSRPGGEIGGGMEVSPRQTDLVIDRDLEWWGDQGAGSDVLTVDGANVLSAATAPRTKMTRQLFVFDRGADGASDIATPIPAYFGIGFITGVDRFIPAGDRSFEVTQTPRGRAAHRTTLRVPALPSTTDRMTLRLRDDD